VPRIDLTHADLQPLDFAERLDLAGADCGDEVLSANEVAISGTVERGGRGYLLDGVLKAAVRLTCARCLQDFSATLDEHLELVLLPSSAAPAEDEIRLAPDDLDVRFFATPELDLVELAAEQVQLAVPVKPLCSDSCRGLCPRCGANLNQGRCSCPETTTDDRWAPLEGWRSSE
jgi:uncharacterized protein